MKLNKLIVGSIIFLFIPLGFYIYNFWRMSLSSDPANWGTFGDYLNPFLTIINIAVLLYLTYTVAKIDSKKAEDSINAQKLITLNQIRRDEVAELAKNIQSVIYKTKHEMRLLINSSYELTGTIAFFKVNNHYLFENLFTDKFNTNFYDPVIDSSKRVSDFLENINKEKPDFDQKLLEEISQDFSQKQAIFIRELNRYILDELTPISQ
jgi:hypothetical protein